MNNDRISREWDLRDGGGEGLWKGGLAGERVSDAKGSSGEREGVVC